MNEVKDSAEFYRNLWAGAEARLADARQEASLWRNDFKISEQRLAESQAEVARLRADAGRYRWLRDHGRTPGHEFDEIAWTDARDALSWTKAAEEIDAAVDHAMRAALEPTR